MDSNPHVDEDTGTVHNSFFLIIKNRDTQLSIYSGMFVLLLLLLLLCFFRWIEDITRDGFRYYYYCC